MSEDLARRLQKLAWTNCDCAVCTSIRQVLEEVQGLQREHDLLLKQNLRLEAALREIDNTLENALTRGTDPFLVGRASELARRALEPSKS